MLCFSLRSTIAKAAENLNASEVHRYMKEDFLQLHDFYNTEIEFHTQNS
jgi:hypothetical protein